MRKQVREAPAIRPVSEMAKACRADFDRLMTARRERNDAAKAKRAVGRMLLRLVEQGCLHDTVAYRETCRDYDSKAIGARCAARNIEGRLRALGWAVMTAEPLP